jgi:HD-GYP domain-containing protein (c-di-GMP phosphodiesterase class II)
MTPTAAPDLAAYAPLALAFTPPAGPRDTAWPARAGASAAALVGSGKHVILGWLVARVDQCDPVSRGHSWRVSRLVRRAAEALGLPSHRVEQLTEAALLHDVGKIAVPPEYLRRAGPLDPAEFEAVKEHAGIGSRILARIPGLAHAAPVARWHHERWDGGGYPGALRRSEVPFDARLVTVLDALDAMTSPRAYREPRSWRDALDELRAHAGTQFDPSLVHAVRAMDWRPLQEEFEGNRASNLCTRHMAG